MRVCAVSAGGALTLCTAPSLTHSSSVRPSTAHSLPRPNALHSFTPPSFEEIFTPQHSCIHILTADSEQHAIVGPPVVSDMGTTLAHVHVSLWIGLNAHLLHASSVELEGTQANMTDKLALSIKVRFQKTPGMQPATHPFHHSLQLRVIPLRAPSWGCGLTALALRRLGPLIGLLAAFIRRAGPSVVWRIVWAREVC